MYTRSHCNITISSSGFAHSQASPQQGDLRLSGPPSSQGAGGGARTRDRGTPADIRTDSLATDAPVSRVRSSKGRGLMFS
ncbi:hypothetical protein PoB_000418700 [Plakobranchus ocellatus]|uniref:Uncharacterized protein n=1 Tax=Plakobranchus ocellatus TaxID=259542 RepID=A0AAV3Y5F5_9GAST|nr:hypothetical protein PoB_000418700 [Plakobranchus ocellatus]